MNQQDPRSTTWKLAEPGSAGKRCPHGARQEIRAERGLPVRMMAMTSLRTSTTGQYEHAHTKRWSRTVAALDAFVFVTPEYNRSTSGVLKTAIDFLYAEWADKAAGFVGYGLHGGTRAIEHLRQILATTGVAGVAPQVTLSIRDDFENFSHFRPAAHHEDSVRLMLDKVVAWAGALRAVRT